MSRPVTFVGLGGGAIQLGLWAYYAHRQGCRVVISEVDRARVAGIRANGNTYAINIAHFDHIEPVTVGPVEVYDPSVPADRVRLLEAVREANEINTAVPSTAVYRKGGIDQLLREGLAGRSAPVLIYASENQIGAAAQLRDLVYPEGALAHVGFSETVIERMGGPQGDPAFIAAHRVAEITPGCGAALLVEDFDSIVVEKPPFAPELGFSTSFGRFRAVEHIGMYEELKLLGHNAVHFLLGCVGKIKGYTYMSDFNGDPDTDLVGLDALILETGGWFRPQYGPAGAEVATDDGFRAWAVQLMRRIVNPHLFDLVDRIIRDPERKLAWNDRIIGTMRRALAAGVVPKRYALGAAAALALLRRAAPGVPRDASWLVGLWGDAAEPDERENVITCVEAAGEVLGAWDPSVHPSLHAFARRAGYW